MKNQINETKLEKKLKERITELLSENEDLKEDLKKMGDSVLDQTKAITKRDEIISKLERIIEIQEQEGFIDFENTEQSVKKVLDMMSGKKWRQIIAFTKQITANVYKSLKEQIERQKNNLKLNEKSYSELKNICSDINDDFVAFE